MKRVLERIGAWGKWLFPFGFLLHEYIHLFTAYLLPKLESEDEFRYIDMWIEWTPNPRCMVEYPSDVDLSYVRVVAIAPTAIGLLAFPWVVSNIPPLFAYRETALMNYGLWVELLSLYFYANYGFLIGPSYKDLWIAAISSDEELRGELRNGVSHQNTPGESGESGVSEGRDSGDAVSGD